MIPDRENMLLPVVEEHFCTVYSKQKKEVPFYDHRIDLYGYSPSTNYSIAVELKLRDWKRALYQALVYQLCSDYVFIAVPESTVQRIKVESLREHGIGLLAISDEKCSVILPAVLSKVVNSQYKSTFTAMMQKL